MPRLPDPFSLLTVSPLEGTVRDEQWFDRVNDVWLRYMCIEANLLVVPYTRQTQGTRWRIGTKGEAVRRYNDAKNAMQNAFSILLKQQGLEPFGGLGHAVYDHPFARWRWGQC